MTNDATPGQVASTDQLGHANEVQTLMERLRAESTGYDEWRVQDPQDGAYCIAFDRSEVLDPEREARDWLADHKRRFPMSSKTGYVVACVRVEKRADRLMLEAAAEIERMRADLTSYFALADASWRETCETAKTAGITSIPIGPAHAAALDKFNDLRALYGPNDRAQRRDGSEADGTSGAATC